MVETPRTPLLQVSYVLPLNCELSPVSKSALQLPPEVEVVVVGTLVLVTVVRVLTVVDVLMGGTLLTVVCPVEVLIVEEVIVVELVDVEMEVEV